MGRLDPILCCQRLKQQYIITAYLKVENNRLTWLRMNQNQMRCEHLQRIMDHVQSSSLNTGNNYKIGKAVIFPSSYMPPETTANDVPHLVCRVPEERAATHASFGHSTR